MTILASAPRRARTFLLALLFCAMALPQTASSAAALTPPIALPTPPGQRWQIIQGYECGTHHGYERLSLDLINLDGPTTGAPIRAAADGSVLVWVPRSGTLILSHGNGFYTQYTHLASAVDTNRGARFTRGQVLGTAGYAGTSASNPHLHFTAFQASGPYVQGRVALALRFADAGGIELPEIGGCNQHGGKVLTADGTDVVKATAELPDGIAFSGAQAEGRWHAPGATVSFTGKALAGGYRAAWNADPGGNEPEHRDAAGTISTEGLPDGLHTLYVRGWALDGTQTLVTYGPLGVDATAPMLSAPEKLPVETDTTLIWDAATDQAAGVRGYAVYIGTDPNGTGDWIVGANQLEDVRVKHGTIHYLRVQPIDFAGNRSGWVTVAEVVREE